jgi:PBSX family phage terminase large subunit
MKMQDLSPKQLDCLINSTARINLLSGSVRSGKTYVSCIRWLDIVAHAPKGANLMICAKNERSIRRNLLDLIASMINPKDFKLNIGMGECFIYGRKIYLTGANDARSEGKLRGLTLYACLADEITLFPEDFVGMLLSRLSDPGAILLCTTNPDNPAHYIKKKFIDRQKELDMKIWTFTMDDNYTLDAEYVKQLKAEYIPGSIFYKRFIQGEWAVAEGAVFPYFTDDPAAGYVVNEIPKSFSRYVVSVDFGQNHPTVFMLGGYSPSDKKWYVIKEFYINNKPVSQFSAAFGTEILPFCDVNLLESIDVDPGGGGLSLLTQLRQDYPELDGRGLINHAFKKDVATELQKMSTAIFNHELVFNRPGCKNVIGEMQGYVWDSKAAQAGKDMPIKTNDDGIDATRYLWNRILMLY